MFLRDGKAPFISETGQMGYQLQKEAIVSNFSLVEVAMSRILLMTLDNTCQDLHGFFDYLAALGLV
jgi:hypothetical protein